MPDFNPTKRLAEARALLEEAKAALPIPAGKLSKRGYRRHDLAYQAAVLLIGPLRYTELAGVLTETERAAYAALLAEAEQIRGYP